MDDNDFAEAMTRMVKDNGKEKLLGNKVKAYVSDYKGQFDTDADIFLRLLKADCAKTPSSVPLCPPCEALKGTQGCQSPSSPYGNNATLNGGCISAATPITLSS